MAILGKLLSGRLTDIANRDTVAWTDGGVDVVVGAVPSGFGPFAYDSVNQLAIPLPVAQQTVDEKVAVLDIPRKVLAALALRQSASWATLTALQQTHVQTIIDNAGVAIVAALT